jgi:3-oxoadipate enol-lactonase
MRVGRRCATVKRTMLRREQIDGVEIAFDDDGAGPAVVLLHPFPLDHRAWSDNAPALVAAGYRVVAPDYPGFGASPAPAAPLSIAAIAHLVVGLLDRLSLPQAAVVGESMGGYIALALAAEARPRLAALVLADTRAAGDGMAALAGRAAAIQAIGTQGVSTYLDQSIPRLLAPDAPAATASRARSLAETKAQTLLDGIAALRDRPNRTAELGALACPTLVLVGSADQVTPAAEMRQMAAAIAGARFVELPGVGHLSNLEAPGAFNQAVLEHLNASMGGRW